MRFRFTLFLLVANLVVFGLIWNNARRRNVEPPRAELIFPTDPDAVTVDTGEPAGSYKLVRTSNRWSLESPYRWPANPWIIRNLIGEMRFISRTGGFSLELARKQGDGSDKVYGFDKPVCTLTVAAAGRDTAVKIGALTADGRARYMLANDGDTILPVPNALITALLRPPAEIRREEVFSLEAFEVRSADVKAGAESKARLVREKRDLPGGDFTFVWRFEIPVPSDANTALVDNRLADLGKLKYLRFIESTPELLAKTGLADPAFTLTLDGNGRSQTLQVGDLDPDAKSPYRFAKLKDNPVIFTLADGALTPWRELPVSMRDPHLLQMDDATLTGITIRIDGVPLVMHPVDVRETAKDPAKNTAPAEWQMPVVPGGKVAAVTPVDPEVLDQLRRSLRNLSARDVNPPAGAAPDIVALCKAFVTDKPTDDQLRRWGLDNPKWRVELTFVRGDKTFRRTLAIAPQVAPGTPYHARVDDSPTVYSIGPAIVASPQPESAGVLSVNPGTYRRRLLFAMQENDTLTALKITDLATTKTLLDERKPADVADWKTWLTGHTEADRKTVAALVAAVAELRAGSFLDRPFSEDFRYDAGDGSAPEAWRYRIEWEIKPAGADDARRDGHTLLATRRLGGTTQLGGLQNAGVVFTLSQNWIDALSPLTFGRDDSVDTPRPPDPASPGAAPKPPADPVAPATK